LEMKLPMLGPESNQAASCVTCRFHSDGVARSSSANSASSAVPSSKQLRQASDRVSVRSFGGRGVTQNGSKKELFMSSRAGLSRYGRDTLITALQCITQTADGNAGFVPSTIVEALCEVRHEAPGWRETGEELLRAMDKFKFADACWRSWHRGDEIFQ
jgi:hypothetical protein